MIDESKIIVLGSVSLRASLHTRTTTTTNDVLRAVSLRASRTQKTNAASDNILENASLAIAGYEHSDGQWQPPEDLSYVVVHV